MLEKGDTALNQQHIARDLRMIPSAAYALPLSGANEIDIAVTHNGLCHSDLHMIDNEWSATKYPFVPGEKCF